MVAMEVTQLACPSCGGITDSSFAHCQHCGAALPTSPAGAASAQDMARLEAAKLQIKEMKSNENFFLLVGGILMGLGILDWLLGNQAVVGVLFVVFGVLGFVAAGISGSRYNRRLAALERGKF